MKQEILARAGIDVAQGLNRCMGDQDLYCQILDLFLEDKSLEEAEEALSRKDYEAMFPCVHTLKGVCGNLAMTDAYREAAELTEILRSGVTNPDAVEEGFTRLREACLLVREGIREAR